mmetsp:Transcript_16161/g.31575  ORF Transcript_16161/g.31575 Transcript_16161/m.31575 type:complete len:88 (-) Transcript_16161:608-871(-)
MELQSNDSRSKLIQSTFDSEPERRLHGHIALRDMLRQLRLLKPPLGGVAVEVRRIASLRLIIPVPIILGCCLECRPHQLHKQLLFVC